MQIHDLKLNQLYYHAVKDGDKTFEVRKNDRNFQAGDLIHFRIVNDDGNDLGNEIPEYFIISYVLKDFEGLADNYVAFSIKKLGDAKL